MQTGSDFYKTNARQADPGMLPRGDHLLDRAVSVREYEIRAQFDRLLHAVSNLEGEFRTLKDRLHEGGVLRATIPAPAGYSEAQKAQPLQSEFGNRIAALTLRIDEVAGSLRSTENILEI